MVGFYFIFVESFALIRPGCSVSFLKRGRRKPIRNNPLVAGDVNAAARSF